MNRAIIVDLDGTLCNTDHRQHFMQQKKKDWKSFYGGIKDDSINEWCEEIIHNFNRSGYEIILFSGRSIDYADATLSWLKSHYITYKYLVMREKGDFRKDFIVKKELYEKYIKDRYDVLFVIDDRKQVVDMWREIGLTCLQCAPGEF